MKKRTFAMIKPDAVACHYTGQIITLIEKAGFRIIAQKMLRLTTSDTNKFYAVHSQRPFFRNLSLFMTSGPVVVMVLEKENALLNSGPDRKYRSTGCSYRQHPKNFRTK